MVIGIMGAPINNINLGCVAMCYSLITMFEAIRKKYEIDIKYIIFDYRYNEQKYNELMKELDIEKSRIIYGGCGNISDPIRVIKHLPGLYRMIINLRKCNFIVDMTEGDSFSDIYGDVIFSGRTNVKLLIERLGIPLILGPQTYGPYVKTANLKKAVQAINNAKLVFARDNISAELVERNGRKDVIRAIDVAFLLPYKKEKANNHKRIRIGINVSSMLYFKSNEMKVQRFKLKADYHKCIHKIIESFAYNDKFELYLIPHVDLDDNANREIALEYPEVKLIEPCSNPVKIKSIISTMDIFIGARMHATIAAFSSGVACIPMAYSRKFTGLYKSLGYHYVVDLENTGTEETMAQLIEYIENYKILKEKVVACGSIYRNMLNKMELLFEKEICKYLVND